MRRSARRRAGAPRPRRGAPAGRSEAHVRAVALLARVVEDDRRRQAHVDRRGRAHVERHLPADADAHHLHRHVRDAAVDARREDRAHLELAEGVVARVLRGADDVVRRARAEDDGRLEGAGEHLDADAEAELLDRLVREPHAADDERRAVERDERVALRRRHLRAAGARDGHRERRHRRHRREDARRHRVLLLVAEAVRPGDGRHREDGRRPAAPAGTSARRSCRSRSSSASGA